MDRMDYERLYHEECRKAVETSRLIGSLPGCKIRVNELGMEFRGRCEVVYDADLFRPRKKK